MHLITDGDIGDHVPEVIDIINTHRSNNSNRLYFLIYGISRKSKL